MTDRTLPHSLDAERSVLGAVLIDNEALLHAQDGLGGAGEVFFRDAHRRIFDAFLELSRRKQPIDLVTLKVYLEDQRDLDECGGPAYLASLTDGVPRATNVEYYAGIVREKWCLRQAIFASQKLLSMAYEGDTPAGEVIDQAERLMLDLSRQHASGDGVDSRTLVREGRESIERRIQERKYITGATTGFTKFDYLTRGLQPGDVILIGGRSSMGKTAVVVQMALHLASLGTLPFYSLEMSRDAILMRMVAAQAHVNYHALLTGHLSVEEQERVADALSYIEQLGLVIDDTTPMTPPMLRSRTRRLAAKGKLVGAILDYIGLVATHCYKAENRQLALTYVSQDLKALAKELRIPIIGLSQLSRAPEQRSDKRPQLSDLRESGSLEQDADVVVLVYRPGYYDLKDESGLTELIVAKQRNGPTGVVKLKFVKEEQRFERWPEKES